MDKENVVDRQNRTLLSHKKEQNNAMCSKTDGPRGYPTKRNKSERERQVPQDIIYLGKLKYDTN